MRILDSRLRGTDLKPAAPHEAVDTSTPMGRAMFHIAGAFAELEREIIRERVKAGLANAKRRGKKLGRRRAMVNLDVVRELTKKGLSGRAIATRVSVSEATVRRLLRDCVKNPAGSSLPKRRFSA